MDDLTDWDWNPRYVAYAKSNGMEPQEQMEFDDIKYPGGIMAGFIIWSNVALSAFRSEHPESFYGNSLVNHAAYDAWLCDFVSTKSQFHHTQTEITNDNA